MGKFIRRSNEAQPAPGINPVRRVIGIVLVVLVIAFALIVTITMRQRIEAAGEAMRPYLWRGLQNDLIVCAGFLIVALGIAFGIMPARQHIALRIVRCAVWVFGLAISLEALFLCGKVVVGSLGQDASPDARFVVVEGTALQKDKSAPVDLTARLNTATAWWKDHGDITLIVTRSSTDENASASGGSAQKVTSTSGGSGLAGRKSSRKGNTTTDVMTSLLKDEGIPKDIVRSEDKSVNVRESFENILAMEDVNEDTPIVVITSNYDITRAVRIAKEAGFTDVTRLPAPSGFWEYGTNILWETWLEYDPMLKEIQDDIM